MDSDSDLDVPRRPRPIPRKRNRSPSPLPPLPSPSQLPPLPSSPTQSMLELFDSLTEKFFAEETKKPGLSCFSGEIQSERLDCICGEKYQAVSSNSKIFFKRVSDITKFPTEEQWKISVDAQVSDENLRTKFLEDENWRIEKVEDTVVSHSLEDGTEILTVHCKCGRYYNFSANGGVLYF
ncbi:hypothetical protein ISN44_As10g028890 [Arabidopsis suecica]|uniref:Uncharacterized protein n=1 Tax=Arabidopsis suecica TaxID=45249 RepID=A0A8T2A3I7_ARASU|nr:hypothetical protein ISN44_As10g028890 [Arabidopsis suecica]